MLTVLTLDQANALLAERFPKRTAAERVPLDAALGRVLRENAVAEDDVPAFMRATVDGYAVLARDTFGCSDAVPMLLTCVGEAAMGEACALTLSAGECLAVPTGGALPQNADAMVMLEDTERLGAATVAVLKPAAPGRHVIFAGDDVRRGEAVLPMGRRLMARDIGTLAAMGIAKPLVVKRPRVAILSTGDELVPPAETPRLGQMRDVNGPMLAAMCASVGAQARFFGIVPDDESALTDAVRTAAQQADLVLLSGGSSVGARDAAEQVFGGLGTVLFHGLAMKPGKPTIAASIGGIPVLGLPGHPVAAYFVFQLLVRPLLNRMQGAAETPLTETATLSLAIPSNHGREEYVPVRLMDGQAVPMMTKSGLISTLARADGYVRIPRDCEGLGRGDRVTVYRWEAI